MIQRLGFMQHSIQVSLCFGAMFVLMACQSQEWKATEHNRVQTPTIDLHSFANTQQVTTHHLHVNLTVNFDDQQLEGYVIHELKYHDQATTQFIVDTQDLVIQQVELQHNNEWQATQYELQAEDPVLGQALVIDVSQQPERVRITYHSLPVATGLDWVEPSGTAGGVHPFLYSQSQPHYARTWLPIQDTPANRFTFSGELFTPTEFLGLMGANNHGATEKTGHYVFESKQSIPSYLMAIAVGDLEFKAYNERMGVYAEAGVLEAAHQEFIFTPDMVRETEAMFGSYAWDRYDLLILPPSYPFGGMENPQLSFITPTAIAGDQSLVSLVAHELAHSWSGNLVTNATWRDLWLNEGFTSYVATRIMERVYSQERADMERMLDAQAIEQSITQLPERYQVLYIDLEQRDPDTAFTSVPYTKAQLFLYFLETRVGRDAFDAFVQQYFQDFAFQSMDTERFLSYLQEQLLSQHSEKVTLDEVQAWVYGTGLPETLIYPTVDLFERVAQQQQAWLQGQSIDTSMWGLHEKLYFLRQLPKQVSHEQLQQLDQEWQLSYSQNAQLLSTWLVIAIEQEYQPGVEPVAAMLSSMGRLIYIMPVYQALAASDTYRDLALSIYQQAKPSYHQLTKAEIEKLLGL